uniref:Putative product n=1 Tax=Xenopsylla cheopis TaxID=163159 RepID=A0A6M2DXD2_XENCH
MPSKEGWRMLFIILTVVMVPMLVVQCMVVEEVDMEVHLLLMAVMVSGIMGVAGHYEEVSTEDAAACQIFAR